MNKVLLTALALLFAGGMYSSAVDSRPGQTTTIDQPVVSAPAYVEPLKVVSKPKTVEYVAATTKQIPTYAPNGTYRNVDGNDVPSPYYADSVPAGATAQCNDGTYSFSQNRRGTCSRHGGVAEWLD